MAQECFKKTGQGAFSENHVYDPVILLKMQLVACLYNLSERQVKEYVNFALLAKCFYGYKAHVSMNSSLYPFPPESLCDKTL